ncbi:hypothetical protein [Corynebacterium lizhenjunii]|uniref:hypothetical protein n=1 Tax=Corynebacterium lizhenjunii TaxID=2709394 RepID=UPI00197E3BBE|nr:hypothetical protein [Corynebacterium lizhenjunii]
MPTPSPRSGLRATWMRRGGLRVACGVAATMALGLAIDTSVAAPPGVEEDFIAATPQPLVAAAPAEDTAAPEADFESAHAPTPDSFAPSAAPSAPGAPDTQPDPTEPNATEPNAPAAPALPNDGTGETPQGALSFPPSPAVEMYIPSINVRAEFESKPCHTNGGAIDPVTMNKACTYTAPDRPYSLPGTSATDVVVIAGHTGAGVPGVFNALYDGARDEHQVSAGDKLYVRTEATGNAWLVYMATDLHAPEKSSLAQNSEVWGTHATPGRLLTISCIQPSNPLASAVRNAVVGWQLVGISGASASSGGARP